MDDLADTTELPSALMGRTSPFNLPKTSKVLEKYFPGLAVHKGVAQPAAAFVDYYSIFGGEKTLETLWKERTAHFPGKALRLGPFAEGDPTGPEAINWLKKKGFAFRRVELERAPFLAIRNSWEEYHTAKRKKFWKNIRRAEKILSEAEGELFFQIAKTPDDISKTLPACLALYWNNWSRLTSQSVFLTAEGETYLQDLLETMSACGKAELATLTQNGNLLAFSIGLTVDSVYYFYIFATDKAAKYEKFSIGKMLLRRVIESAFKRNYSVFDFMSGEEAYKLEWTRNSRGRFALYATDHNIIGRTCLSWAITRLSVETVIKKNSLVRSMLRTIARWVK